MKTFLLLLALAVPAIAADTLERKAPPPLTQERRVEEPKTVRLPGPLPLDVTTDNERPYVRLVIVLGAAGEAAQPPALGGIADLTAALVQEGAVVLDRNGRERTLDSKAYAEALDELGASVSIVTGGDAAYVTVGALKNTLSETVALVAAAIRRPTLDAPGFERLKRQTLLALRQQSTNPENAASLQARRRVYGEQAYGTVATPASVGRITLGDARAFHAASFGPTSISAVGVIDMAALKQLVEEHFLKGPGLAVGDIAQAQNFTRVPTPDARAAAREGDIDLINLPGSEQSFVLVVQAGLEREHEDYDTLRVLNMILGGVHESRLESIIREEKGWAYFARSAVPALKRGGRIALESPIRAEATAQALQTMLAQLELLRTADVGAAELAAAKTRLLSGIDDIFENNESIASRRANEAVIGLPADAIARERTQIAAVTVADVRRIAGRYLRPDACAVIIAGDKQVVLPQLQTVRPARAVNVIEPDGVKPRSAD